MAIEKKQARMENPAHIGFPITGDDYETPVTRNGTAYSAGPDQGKALNTRPMGFLALGGYANENKTGEDKKKMGELPKRRARGSSGKKRRGDNGSVIILS